MNNSTKCLKSLAKYFYSTAPPKQQFNRFFLLKLNYNPNAYYLTFPYKKQFKEQITKIQTKQNIAYIFGGHNFPMDQSIFVFNCDTIDIVQNFAKNNPFHKRKAIADYTIDQVQKQSSEKMRKLWQFYQIK